MKSTNPNYVTFKVPDGLIQIQVTDISHFFIEDSKIKMHLKNGDNITILETMKELESLLYTHGFIRIHQKCILGLNQRLKYCEKARSIRLSDDCDLAVAKHRIKEVRIAILNNSCDQNFKV